MLYKLPRGRDSDLFFPCHIFLWRPKLSQSQKQLTSICLTHGWVICDQWLCVWRNAHSSFLRGCGSRAWPAEWGLTCWDRLYKARSPKVKQRLGKHLGGWGLVFCAGFTQGLLIRDSTWTRSTLRKHVMADAFKTSKTLENPLGDHSWGATRKKSFISRNTKVDCLGH